MERYYYHGIEPYPDDNAISLQQLINIIKSGAIKTYDKVRGKKIEGMNHICLYKKDETVDYLKRKPFPLGEFSALDAWINNCLVFIISPDINAYKPIYKKDYNRSKEETNVFDEWRTNEDIPIEKIVGLALPFDWLKEMAEENKIYYEKLNELLTIAKEYNWMIVNSEEENFTDKLDETLITKKQQL